MKLVLVDTNWKNFLPLCFTRPVGEVRIGILKLREKWSRLFQLDSLLISEDYLNKKYFAEFEGGAYLLNSKVLPDADLVKVITALSDKEMLTANGTWVAIKSESGFNNKSWEGLTPKLYSNEISTLENWWDIYLKNGAELQKDFDLLTEGKTSQAISDTNLVIGDSNQIFLEEGVYLEGCTLNTQSGPIYVGANSEIMEGSIIRGGFAALNDVKIKLGAKIYGPTTVGPKCRVGGEVKNSVIQGYSNKSHDGYLGNSVLGEWINLGADTNCSNLKNTFSTAKVWDYAAGDFKASEQTFIGACIGDYAKTGINTMLNTGTSVGVNANVFGSDFPPKKVASFSWGGREQYDLSKSWSVNQNIANMNGESLHEVDQAILKAVFELDNK